MLPEVSQIPSSTPTRTSRYDQALVVRDKQGKPLAAAKFVATGRKTPQGQEHGVYFQASEPIQIETDAHGRVELDCFARGDNAEVYVQVPDDDWKPLSFTIPEQGDEIEVTAS